MGYAQLGHWEGDTMIGKGMQGGLLTLVERKARYLRGGVRAFGPVSSGSVAVRKLVGIGFVERDS